MTHEVIRPSAPDGLAQPVEPADRQFHHRLSHPGVIDSAPRLVWRCTGASEPTDWAATADRTRLFSPRLRELLDAYRSSADEIQWIDASLLTSEGEPLRYFVAHFPEHLDIYDVEATTWGPSGLPIRWVLSPQKIAVHHVFVPPSLYDVLIVSTTVADALRSAGITGLAFERARLAPTNG